MSKINRIRLLVISVVMLMIITINGRVNAATLSTNVVGTGWFNLLSGGVNIKSVTITNVTGTYDVRLIDSPNTSSTFYVNSWSNIVYVTTNIVTVTTNVLTGVKQTNTWDGVVPQWKVIQSTNIAYPVILSVNGTNGYITVGVNKVANNGLLLQLSGDLTIIVDYTNVR